MQELSAKQTHRIKRLLFELNIEQQDQARHVHAEVSRFCQNRIESLLDTCLANSVNDNLYRIDRLELDLGQLDPDNLERDILHQLEQQLRRELPDQLRQAQDKEKSERDVYIQSRLELLNMYARQGHLPWWADQNQSEPLSETLEQLIESAAEILIQHVPALVRHERALLRLVSRCNDDVLIRLGKLLCPSQAKILSDYSSGLVEILHQASRQRIRDSATTLEKIPQFMGHPRRYVWQAILHTMVYTSSAQHSQRIFWKDVILRIAVISHMRYDQLLYSLYQSMESSTSVITTVLPLKELLNTLYKELASTRLKHTPVNVPGSETVKGNNYRVNAETSQQIDNCKQQYSMDEVVQNRIQGERENLQQNLQQRGIDDWNGVEASPIEVKDSISQTRFYTETDIEQAESIRGRSDGHSDEIRATEHNSQLDPFEESYIENAGLVILGPFLERFFNRLGLLDERHFKDHSAAQRAVSLLQYIATQDPLGPEYVLPLNKILCGIEPQSVFEEGPALSEDELLECDQLLQAVIEHASILRKMSVAGFRGSFLLRKGLLESRDGAWLLRVERESYDVVLDRFPWSFSWLKFPWMNLPLRVEW